MSEPFVTSTKFKASICQYPYLLHPDLLKGRKMRKTVFFRSQKKSLLSYSDLNEMMQSLFLG